MTQYRRAEREVRYLRRRQAGLMPILSEGDSWFDYPFYRNLIDLVDDTERFAIKRLEISGDVVSNMIGIGPPWADLQALEALVVAEQPRFVLFSGGGNDMAHNVRGMFNAFIPGAPPSYYLDTDPWRNTLRNVEAAYVMLARAIGPHAPVFVHGYDFFVPAWRAVRYDGIGITGPWVIPEMEAPHIRITDPELQRAIARLMINIFNEMLAAVAADHPGLLVHVDLRGVLAASDWENEIHPTEGGFFKLARRFLPQLYQGFPRVMAVRADLGLPRRVA